MATRSRCSFCDYYSTSGNDIVRHLFEAHSEEPGFVYECMLPECKRVFTTGASYSTFVSHSNRKHFNWRQQLEYYDHDLSHLTDEEQGEERNEVSQVASEASMAEVMNFNELTFDEVGTECIHSNDICIPQTSLLAAHFLLQLKEQHHATQAAINFTVKSVQDIIMLLQQNSLSSIPNDGCSIADPFHQLNTEYQQINSILD